MNVSIVAGTYNMLIRIRIMTFYTRVQVRKRTESGLTIFNGNVQIYIYYKYISISVKFIMFLIIIDKWLNIMID